MVEDSDPEEDNGKGTTSSQDISLTGSLGAGLDFEAVALRNAAVADAQLVLSVSDISIELMPLFALTGGQPVQQRNSRLDP
jgi:hypothetical protein